MQTIRRRLVRAILPVTIMALMLAWVPFASAALATGGNVTNDVAGYRSHIFTNSATASSFVADASNVVAVLVVAGGGRELCYLGVAA